MTCTPVVLFFLGLDRGQKPSEQLILLPCSGSFVFLLTSPFALLPLSLRSL